MAGYFHQYLLYGRRSGGPKGAPNKGLTFTGVSCEQMGPQGGAIPATRNQPIAPYPGQQHYELDGAVGGPAPRRDPEAAGVGALPQQAPNISKTHCASEAVD